jgi:ABC-2 type transport system ATP-binding protein
VIEIAGLTKKYGAFTALDNLELAVAKGELFAFLGPNGAGKTTTMQLMMGMLVPTSGTARINGLDCFKSRVAVKRHVGFLPDNPVFYDYLRGREIVEFAAEMHGQKRSAAAARASELLDQFQLKDAGEEYAVNYSTGMRKLLGLACALVHDPAVLILDEPSNGLDPRAAHEVDRLLTGLRDRGKTIFLSTHLLERAERVASRVAIIDGGRIVASGTIAELKAEGASGHTLEDVFLRVTEPPTT